MHSLRMSTKADIVRLCFFFPQKFYDTETLDLGVVVYPSSLGQEGGRQKIPGQPDPPREFQASQGFIDRQDLN